MITAHASKRRVQSVSRFRHIDQLLPLVGVLALFIIWWLISVSGWVNPVLLPTPWTTIATLFQAMFTGNMAIDFGATVLRTFSAFLLAALVGVPLGVALGSSEKLYRSVEFLIDFFRSMPASALIPMFILFFGVSDFSKVVIAAFGALLLIVFNSAYGVINAKQSRILAAKVMGANRWRVFTDVLLMESLPQTFIGLRSGISISLVIVIVAEMFIGTEQGLGKRIIDAQQVLNVQDMYASILVTGLLGYFLNVLFLLVEKRVIHWSGK
ncbi:ABC transporter permease [Oculatella sp. FACHB-28]|uniref:ABC transporter permease n=1 Tax=Oculatella sp. FACHB-28 TaxID=2692845 RepID=UPI001681D8F2|nr:ABC transporter permease [Oculatella sp. FACHB-28]MBD2056025.1 ABC transporter permease [Oculatella sp. FACHB-28]